MPSPIAHCSMVALLTPLEQRGWVPAALTRHKKALFALTLFACVAPDADFAIRAVAPGTALGTHGHGMHSLFTAAGVALLLALLWQSVFRKGFAAVLVIAAFAAWSHLLLDMVTNRSRGIGLLWPIVDERLRLPINLFYGVRHDQPLAWQEHLVTVGTELMFALAVWLVCKRLARGTRPVGEPTPGVNQA